MRGLPEKLWVLWRSGCQLLRSGLGWKMSLKEKECWYRMRAVYNWQHGVHVNIYAGTTKLCIYHKMMYVQLCMEC